MKKLTTLVLAAVAILALTGCGLDAPPEWEGTANPLDTPETNVSPPPSMGYFGPHSEHYSRKSFLASTNR